MCILKDRFSAQLQVPELVGPEVCSPKTLKTLYFISIQLKYARLSSTTLTNMMLCAKHAKTNKLEAPKGEHVLDEAQKNMINSVLQLD